MVNNTNNKRKRLENRSGIYKIKNLENDKIYIGQSVTVRRRVKEHMNKLRDNKHENKHLQNSWNKNGEKSFVFELVEYCDREELNSREVYWMNYFKSYEKKHGYNITRIDPNSKKLIFSKETLGKMSANRRLYTDEELISYLHDFYYAEGRMYMSKDSKNPRFQGYPKKHCYDVAFGSFEKALEQAGLSEYDKNSRFRRRDFHTRDSILLQYKDFMEEYKRFPKHTEIGDTTKYDLPTIDAVIKIFGGIMELREALGYTYEMQLKEEKEDALLKLREEYDRQGFLSYIRVNAKESSCRSVQYYKSNFGSMDEAYALAGISVEENKKRRNLYAKKLRKNNRKKRGELNEQYPKSS